MENLFHPNILSEITKFLNYVDLTRLMLSCKDLLFKIGRSNVWVKSKKLTSDQFAEFRNILPLLITCSLTKNKFPFRDYYDVCYYFSKFLYRDPYFLLADLLKSSKTDLKNFGKIIKYIIEYENIYHFYEYNLDLKFVVNNLDLFKETFSSIPEKITNLILLKENLDLSSIIINVNNKNHSLGIISKISYIKFGTVKDLILPNEKGYYFGRTKEAKEEYFKYTGKNSEEDYFANMSDQAPDKYGNISNPFLEMSINFILESVEIKEYFTLIGNRLNIDPGLLSSSTELILETLGSIYTELTQD